MSLIFTNYIPKSIDFYSTHDDAFTPKTQPKSVGLQPHNVNYHIDYTKPMLGEGTYAITYQASFDDQPLAVKIINKTKYSKKPQYHKLLLIRLTNEIRILERIKHPNIIKLLYYAVNDHYVALFTELIPGGNLQQLCVKQLLPRAQVYHIWTQLINAISYLHDHYIVHRDIKLENILLDQDRIVLIDFGFACYQPKYQGQVLQKLSEFLGTFEYSAPEIINNIQYDGYKTDTWACGVALYILFTRKYPFEVISDNQIDRIATAKLISEGNFKPVTNTELNTLLKGILEPNPDKRWDLKVCSCHKLK
jgi:serine/threonine protein kinase